MDKRKLLVLGGKPIGSLEIVKAVQEAGHHAVVTDFLSLSDSPAKQISDQYWNISTDDIEELKKRALQEGIEGVLAGVHEFNIHKMTVLAEELGLPCYSTEEQQLLCADKSRFKARCKACGLDVAREYSTKEAFALEDSCYPLAVKPRDGSGSRGFSKCSNRADLSQAIALAAENSFCGKALIEEFIESDALVAQYTAHKGKIYFSGLTDKQSKKMGDVGAPIMALQIAPSVYTEKYLIEVDQKMKELLSSLDVKEGPVWIELFYANDRFIVNEIGYRFGGSLTYHLVRELYGIDQLRMMIDFAAGSNTEMNYKGLITDELYAIWPLHLKPGKITMIEGLEWLKAQSAFVALAQVHFADEEIEDWGSAKQVFGYLHLKDLRADSLLRFMCEVLENVKVLDAEGNNLLFALFDPFDKKAYPAFLKKTLTAERPC